MPIRDFEMNRVELSVDTLPVDETIEETEQKEQKGIALDPPVVPEEEDCADDTVPELAKKEDSVPRMVPVADLISMTKIFYQRYRLSLYSFLNHRLRDGSLSRIIGERVLNRVINREACTFLNNTYLHLAEQASCPVFHESVDGYDRRRLLGKIP